MQLLPLLPLSLPWDEGCAVQAPMAVVFQGQKEAVVTSMFISR